MATQYVVSIVPIAGMFGMRPTVKDVHIAAATASAVTSFVGLAQCGIISEIQHTYSRCVFSFSSIGSILLLPSVALGKWNFQAHFSEGHGPPRANGASARTAMCSPRRSHGFCPPRYKRYSYNICRLVCMQDASTLRSSAACALVACDPVAPTKRRNYTMS